MYDVYVDGELKYEDVKNTKELGVILDQIEELYEYKEISIKNKK